jgi:hypothetical protein
MLCDLCQRKTFEGKRKGSWSIREERGSKNKKMTGTKQQESKHASLFLYLRVPLVSSLDYTIEFPGCRHRNKHASELVRFANKASARDQAPSSTQSVCGRELPLVFLRTPPRQWLFHTECRRGWGIIGCFGGFSSGGSGTGLSLLMSCNLFHFRLISSRDCWEMCFVRTLRLGTSAC